MDTAAAGASAASLQWIMKDLVGSLARVLFAGIITDRVSRACICLYMMPAMVAASASICMRVINYYSISMEFTYR